MPVHYIPIPKNLHLGLAYASGSVFANRTFDGGESQEDRQKTANDILSHLILQMLLYFNVFFFPFWWISAAVMLELKFDILPGYYQGVLVTGMVLITAFEGLRLYLGVVGNLKEKVPELAGFWLLTFLLQLPILLFFLTDNGIIILPLERAMHSLYLVFLLSEILAALQALRVMTRKLTLQFHLRQLRESDGLMERFNCTLATQLSVLTSQHQRDWERRLRLVLWACRSTVQESTGCSPALLMFGRELRTLVDKAAGTQGDRVWVYRPQEKRGLCPKLSDSWDILAPYHRKESLLEPLIMSPPDPADSPPVRRPRRECRLPQHLRDFVLAGSTVTGTAGEAMYEC
ncbi:transmembrane protein 17A [Scleropages formosus]|uniref:transmembrane protein 17A n=1 Tax=Scleropages formosus TaxID=113540 RepID=UPI0010FA986E|nr:transmembrane protein 17A-like [Scleropages formosus]